jgi:hypothetical protein
VNEAYAPRSKANDSAMTSYRFDIVSDGATTTEIVEAIDDGAAIRQALLLVSEIVRDRALSNGGAITVSLSVRDQTNTVIWSGSASGGQDVVTGA